MPFTEQPISLERICLEDHCFQVTTEASVEGLIASISAIGMMHPPILLEGDSGYRIVAGFRRIHACRSLGFSAVSARVLLPDTDRRTCVQLAVADNSLQRPLNPIETSRALKLLSAVFSETRMLCSISGALGLPDNYPVIQKLQKLCDLPSEIQEGVISGMLSLAMALELGQMENACGIELCRLFSQLKIGLNKQREILTIIQEIAFRERVRVTDVMQSPEFRQIVQHEKWDRSQKTVQLRQYLRRRRYPAITAYEKDFETKLQALELGAGLTLIPPRDFEGTTFTFQLNFESPAQLRDHVSRLSDISSHPSIQTLLKDFRSVKN